MKHIIKIKYLIAYLFLFILFIFFLPKSGHRYDVNECWASWTVDIMNRGLPNIYQNLNVNYFPSMMWIFYFFSLFFDNPNKVFENIYLIKIETLFFDFVSIWYFFKLLKKYKSEKTSFILSLFVLFNVGFFYNTLFWNQFDGIYTCFAFLSIYYGLEKKIEWSIILMFIGLNIKPQFIIFTPIIFLTNWESLLKISFLNLLKILTYCFAIQLLIIFPFIHNIPYIIKHVLLSVSNTFQKISMNAFNIWCLIYQSPLFDKSDIETKILNIAVKYWGLMFFFVTSGLSILIVFQRQIKKHKVNANDILLLSSLISILFFYLNTEMHERYLHPTILFFGTYCLLNNRLYSVYGLLSILYFYQLNAILMIVKIPFDPITSPVIVAIGFLIVLLFIVRELFFVAIAHPKTETENQVLA